MAISKITSWKADSQVLEIGIWIEPWEQVGRYRREFTSTINSHASRWVWLNGTKESGQRSEVNEVLAKVLDKLVQDHEMLGLFCKKYGIGTDTNERN